MDPNSSLNTLGQQPAQVRDVAGAFFEWANNMTTDGHQGSETTVDWTLRITLTVFLCLIIITTIIGNAFVILAILKEKSLKSVSNYLILSLALTDLLVAAIVMPIGTLYQFKGQWTFGSILCDIWLSADVLCCTASILHLLAIAVDRYFAVTNIDYIHKRSTKHIGAMILAVWVIAGIISLAPIFGWKDSNFEERIHRDKLCLYSQDVGYQLFATFFSFYGPVVLTLCLYYRVYQEAKRRIRRKTTSRSSKVTLRGKHSGESYNLREEDGQETTTALMTTTTCTTSSSLGSSKSGNGGAVSQMTATTTVSSGLNVNRSDSSHLLSVPVFTISGSTSPMAANPLSSNPIPVNNNGVDPGLELCMDSSSKLERECLDSEKNAEGEATPTVRTSFSPRTFFTVRPLFGRTLSKTRNYRFDDDRHQREPRQEDKNQLEPDQMSVKRRKLTKSETIESQDPANDNSSSARERRAAKILMIITGVFVCCWLPFFILALIMPLCQNCRIDKRIIDICLWLGYTNSMINPLLYTFFSPDFRAAFKKFLHL